MASDCRIVLKAPSLEVKQTWVRRLREVIQVKYLYTLNTFQKSIVTRMLKSEEVR